MCEFAADVLYKLKFSFKTSDTVTALKKRQEPAMNPYAMANYTAIAFDRRIVLLWQP